MNEEQEKAVVHHDGPLLIVAGAGTGKTYVIVEKIKHLIKNGLAKPEQILALTFTEKAAAEMEERVDVAMPYGYFQMWISTFHAFADSILKEEGAHIGLNSGFKLMTEAETIIYLRQNLFLFNLNYFRPLGNPNKFLGALLQHFSRLKDEDISPTQYIEWAQNQKLKAKSQNEEEKIEIEKNIELAEAYNTYEQIKTKEGVFDFSDLVYSLLCLFRTRPNILKKYQRQFTHVLVDEFQDTNITQYSLIKLLCPAETQPQLTIVGDDSQAIYKFRGASISNILNFMKDYPRAKQITLQKNYRSNQSILDAAYKLIKHNDPDTLEARLGISKKLISQRPDEKDSLRFYFAQRLEEEADFVANEILKIGGRFSDFALLTRANNHADTFIRAFARKGIPYRFLGPGMLLKQPEIKDLIAYLKVLYNIEDSISLYRVLSMEIFSLDAKDIHSLLIFSKKINRPLFQALEIYLSFIDKNIYEPEWEIYKKYLPFLRKETKEILTAVYHMVKRHLGLVNRETAGQILYFFLEDTKYLNRLAVIKTAADEKIAANISKFFSKLKTFESDRQDASVFAAVDYLEMSMELGESPLTDKADVGMVNAVNLLTVHSAKGLEFPIVFLTNLTRGRFPTYERKEQIPIPQELIKEILPAGDYHEQEERRLFYVGLTRAKDRFYLTASRFYGEGKREQRISPFVTETLGEELLRKQQLVKKEEKSQLSIFDYKKREMSQPAKPVNPLTNQPTNFSYTQLDTYERCPLQYKYQCILKIPTAPAAALSFGNTIHKTLQKFYQEFIKDKTYDRKNIFDIYRQMWIPVGYASAAHEMRMKKEGEKILAKYLAAFHDPKLRILDLEKLFKIKIDNDIFITGKIDRIDQTDDKAIEIIDYKTGKQPDQKELEKSIQLSIYALAAIDNGLYRKKIEDVHLTFYYLNDTEKISLQRTAEDLEKVKTNIRETVSKIRSSDFLPKVGPWCDFCAFRIICEAWQ